MKGNSFKKKMRKVVQEEIWQIYASHQSRKDLLNIYCVSDSVLKLNIAITQKIWALTSWI